jgi:hypothetical protein
MSKWVVLALIVTFLIASIFLASRFDNALAGQVIATSASISVAVVGFWLYFRKAKT